MKSILKLIIVTGVFQIITNVVFADDQVNLQEHFEKFARLREAQQAKVELKLINDELEGITRHAIDILKKALVEDNKEYHPDAEYEVNYEYGTFEKVNSLKDRFSVRFLNGNIPIDLTEKGVFVLKSNCRVRTSFTSDPYYDVPNRDKSKVGKVNEIPIIISENIFVNFDCDNGPNVTIKYSTPKMMKRNPPSYRTKPERPHRIHYDWKEYIGSGEFKLFF